MKYGTVLKYNNNTSIYFYLKEMKHRILNFRLDYNMGDRENAAATVQGFSMAELITVLEETMKDENYEEGDYSEMMESIITHFKTKSSISERQAEVIRMHLKINFKCWF